MNTYTFYIPEMHCNACELFVTTNFKNLKYVHNVHIDLYNRKVDVTVEDNKSKQDILPDLNKCLEDSAYTLHTEPVKIHSYNDLFIALAISVILIISFFLIEKQNIVSFFDFSNLSYPIIFLIGVIASISSCMAVVGSLVLTLSSSVAKHSNNKAAPLIIFHASRLISFFILGGIIGYLGGLFRLPPDLNFVFNLIFITVMIILGLNLLDINKFQFTLPKNLTENFLAKKKASKLGPILLGILTFLLPCGFTQSMQIYALSTGSFLKGALTMLSFSLGTLPVLILISFISVAFANSKFAKILFKTSGFIIIFFALYNLYAQMVVRGILYAQ